MTKKTFLVGILAIALVIGMTVVGCDDSSNPSDNRPELTGTVTINNTSPKVGDTLTAAYSGGNGTGTATWQWIQGESTNIGTNSSTYTVAAADEGKTIKVQVSFADQNGSRTSAATSAVTNIVDNRPELTGTVTIDNTSPKVGDTLTAAYSGGNGTGTATWQWIQGESTNIGTNSSTYTVAAADEGKTIKVQVSFADQKGSRTSAATSAVTNIVDNRPELTGTVTINNTSPKVGDTLTAAYSGGNGTGTAAWQWIQGASTNIGTNSNTYTVTAADEGKTIKIQVSFADQKGSRTSAATSAVTAADNRPELTGTVTIDNTSPKVGDTLTAAYSDGNGTGTAAWQWIRGASTNIGTNSSEYTVVEADWGQTIKVQVSFADQTNSVTSTATDIVQGGQLTLDKWTQMLQTIQDNASFDGTLDLSGYTRTTNYSGVLNSQGSFDPTSGSTGKGKIKNIILPDTAASITSGAFYGFSVLETVAGANITAITTVFQNNTVLKSVDFPKVTSIANNAFAGCTNLETVDFPAATSIGNYAFDGCTKLNTINFPEVLTIGNTAFNGCTGLTQIIFPKATSLGGSAFSGCTNLINANFPMATSIGGNAFEDCAKLTRVQLPAAASIGAGAFSGAGPKNNNYTYLHVKLGKNAPNLGTRIFGSATTPQKVGVEIPYDVNWSSYSYSSEYDAEDGVEGTDSSNIWGNGFRGAGWSNNSTITSGFRNSNITLQFFHWIN